jgi:hypothetical protein
LSKVIINEPLELAVWTLVQWWLYAFINVAEMPDVWGCTSQVLRFVPLFEYRGCATKKQPGSVS